jgi:type I restriction enzyme S subunit
MSWPVVKIAELCEILDNKRKPITKKNRIEGPYPYYGATGILDYVEGFLFDEDLVLIGEDGAKWGVGDNSAFAITGKTWVNNHAHVVKPYKDKVLDSWLIYFLNGEDLSDFITGMTVPKLNQGKLKEIAVPLPPIPEQKRIVALLDTVFADLEQTRAKTEQNLKNARELFDSYLQQVFSQKGKGCEQVSLSKITESISDGDHSAPPKSDEGIPFITISNINKKTLEIDFSNTFKVPEEYYSALKSNRKPKAGDVLYTVTGSYGIPVIVKKHKDFCFQRHIGLIRPNNETNSQWLYYLLMSPQVFNQADSGATGTAQKTVSLTLLRSILVPNIPLNIQKEMVQGLDDIYEKSKALEDIYQKKLSSIDELKKSILQKAFNGELTTTAN